MMTTKTADPNKGARNRLFSLLFFLFFGADGDVLPPGEITFVGDGDTMIFRSAGGESRKIRLYGVDCPEWGQPGGKDAARFTRSLVLSSRVNARVMDTDQYGRAVAIVTLPDGRILNEELLKKGHAWVYTAHCKIARCARWQRLEAGAREKKIEIWRDKNPLPPWRWRRSHPRRK